MTDFTNVQKNLAGRGFSVKTFSTGAEAAAYLDGAIDGKSVGFGGSMTIQELGLHDKLASHNDVHWHWTNGPAERAAAMGAQVYITSVNGLAETGELINIDGAGNRVAGTLFGHEKVYFIVGRNKLAPTYDQALWRARNIAAPKNAQRLNCKTPCAVTGQCADCHSPARVCCTTTIHQFQRVKGRIKVLLVGEPLGF